MSEIDYTKLKRSFQNLVVQYEFFLTPEKESLPKNLQEAVQESVIQRFEICFDSLHKALRKHLESTGVTFEKPDPSPNQIFIEFFKDNLIDDLQVWVNRRDGYTQMRANTSHDYSEEKAIQVLSIVGRFIGDCEKILRQLSI